MNKPEDDQPVGRPAPGPYRSPLRAAQAAATRELILRTAVELLAGSPEGGPTVIEVARAAGVRERTLYRHFATREELLAAAWTRIGEKLWDRLGTVLDPQALPVENFARMDAAAGLAIGALTSASGRQMRRRGAAARRAQLKALLARETAGLPAARRREVEAIVALLSDAWGWIGLREEGLAGPSAAAAATWAIGAVIDALRRERLAPARSFAVAAPDSPTVQIPANVVLPPPHAIPREATAVD